jgi:hypothetical protein
VCRDKIRKWRALLAETKEGSLDGGRDCTLEAQQRVRGNETKTRPSTVGRELRRRGGMSTVELTYANASLEILPYGLHLRCLALKQCDDAEPFDVLVGPEDASVLLQERSFRNSVVGRYANRLPNKVKLPNGSIAQLEGNSEVLHGGVGCC